MSKLSSIAREIMRLLVNCRILPKSISLEQSCYERSQAVEVASLDCLFFDVKKGPKTDFEKCY